MQKCRTCGKEFDVLWPELWRYKKMNGNSTKTWYCSWKCLRADENRKGENEMQGKNLLTEAQKRKAIKIALDGENPLPYLKKCGATNATTTWNTVRNWAKRNCDKGVYEELPEKFGPQKKDLKPVVEVADTLPPWEPGTPKPPVEPEQDWIPAEEVYPKEEPKVELVYDESIAEEYRREQAAKKAAEKAAEEPVIRYKDVMAKISAREQLKVCAVRSEALEFGRYSEYLGNEKMMLTAPEVSMMMDAKGWIRFSEEIRQALEQLGIRAVDENEG